ncbi:hypothetical protein D3C80_1934840 [compost metagenome]
MVVAAIEGVVNGEPEPIAAPPVGAVYHLMVAPVFAVAVRFNVPAPQRTAPLADRILLT